jgi:hypothetical protein
MNKRTNELGSAPFPPRMPPRLRSRSNRQVFLFVSFESLWFLAHMPTDVMHLPLPREDQQAIVVKEWIDLALALALAPLALLALLA